MEKRVIRSTSLASAECSDVVLRKTATTRLVFRPQLVDNPNDHTAAVHGTFLFQRKGPKDKWEDTQSIPLSTLKKGEGVRLELRAKEVLDLFKELADLYNLHARDGIPLGETELIRADSVLAQVAAVPRDQIRTYLSTHRSIGEKLMSTLLTWATEIESPATLVPRLVSLESITLQNLKCGGWAGEPQESASDVGR